MRPPADDLSVGQANPAGMLLVGHGPPRVRVELHHGEPAVLDGHWDLHGTIPFAPGFDEVVAGRQGHRSWLVLQVVASAIRLDSTQQRPIARMDGVTRVILGPLVSRRFGRRADLESSCRFSAVGDGTDGLETHRWALRATAESQDDKATNSRKNDFDSHRGPSSVGDRARDVSNARLVRRSYRRIRDVLPTCTLRPFHIARGSAPAGGAKTGARRMWVIALLRRWLLRRHDLESRLGEHRHAIDEVPRLDD